MLVDRGPGLPKIWWTPECELGFTRGQVEQFFGPQVAEFDRWMSGQTIGLCEGRKWNPDAETYEPACDGLGHGPAYYAHDVYRYLKGLPVVD